MNKKIIIAIVLIASILSGCGRNSSIDKNHTDDQTAASKESEELSMNSVESESDSQEQEKKLEMQGELTISTMFEQEFLSIAAEKFMELYPDVKVTINIFKGENNEQSVENYRTYLNTKIMTGKAEDIIFTTQLPVEKYIEMNVFEDLNHYISTTQNINNDNYFMNVLESGKDEKGEIYYIPYMSAIEAVNFDNRLEKESGLSMENKNSISFTAATTYARQLIDKTSQKNSFITQMGIESYTNYLIKDNLEVFVNTKKKEVNIDTNEYRDLISQVDELVNGKYFAETGKIDYYNTDYYLALTVNPAPQAAYFNLTHGQYSGNALPLGDIAGNVYTNVNYCMGINSESESKELAWEFMKFLISDDIQNLPSIYGLAVNKNAFRSSVERYYNYYSDGESGSVDIEEYEALLIKWINQINRCSNLDPVIENYFVEENKKYFEGKQTSKDTAVHLQKKIYQYFNE